jgi:hypothetical protein
VIAPAPELDAPAPPADAADMLQAIVDGLARLERAVAELKEIGRVEPEYLTPDQTAVFLGLSRARVYAMDRSGQIGPEMVSIAGARRFARRELVLWVEHGAVDRPRWRLMRDMLMRRDT